MFTKQVRFRCEGDDAYFGGILIDDHEKVPYVICGCCGGIMTMDDIEEIQEYENWVDISNEIIGG